MENNNIPFATELIHEIKAASRRWFIAFLVMVILEAVTICGFMWYLSLPVEEYSTIEQESDNASRNFIIGGNYGSETEGNNLQEESNQK